MDRIYLRWAVIILGLILGFVYIQKAGLDFGKKSDNTSWQQDSGWNNDSQPVPPPPQKEEAKPCPPEGCPPPQKPEEKPEKKPFRRNP